MAYIIYCTQKIISLGHHPVNWTKLFIFSGQSVYLVTTGTGSITILVSATVSDRVGYLAKEKPNASEFVAA